MRSLGLSSHAPALCALGGTDCRFPLNTRRLRGQSFFGCQSPAFPQRTKATRPALYEPGDADLSKAPIKTLRFPLEETPPAIACEQRADASERRELPDSDRRMGRKARNPPGQVPARSLKFPCRRSVSAEVNHIPPVAYAQSNEIVSPVRLFEFMLGIQRLPLRKPSAQFADLKIEPPSIRRVAPNGLRSSIAQAAIMAGTHQGAHIKPRNASGPPKSAIAAGEEAFLTEHIAILRCQSPKRWYPIDIAEHCRQPTPCHAANRIFRLSRICLEPRVPLALAKA